MRPRELTWGSDLNSVGPTDRPKAWAQRRGPGHAGVKDLTLGVGLGVEVGGSRPGWRGWPGGGRVEGLAWRWEAWGWRWEGTGKLVEARGQDGCPSDSSSGSATRNLLEPSGSGQIFVGAPTF